MQSKKLLLTIVVLSFFLQGCETVKGAKRDVKNVFFKGEESVVYKVDRWIKDRAW